ncbi:MAG: O-antigen ligase family protein [Bacteroidales bacterium]|nr:O-antigen ligase family protein [Bacteroidales bacterium]
MKYFQSKVLIPASFLLLVPLLYIPDIQSLTPFLRELFLSFLLLILVGIYSLRNQNFIAQLLDKNPLNWLPLVLTALVALQSPFTSIFPQSSLKAFNLLELWLLIQLFRYAFQQSKTATPILSLLIIFASINTFLAIFQLINGVFAGLNLQESGQELTGISGSSFLFSATSLLLLPFILSYALITSRKSGLFTYLLFFIQLFLLILTGNEISLAVLLVGTALAVLVILFIFMKYRLSTQRIRQILIFSALTIVFIVGSFYALRSFDSSGIYQSKTNFMTDYHYGEKIEKTDIWDQSMEIYREHPRSGTGSDTWAIFFPSKGLDDIRNAADDANLPHPSNEFILLLVENGLPGFVFFSLIWVFALIFLIRRIIRTPSLHQQVIQTTFLVVLLYALFFLLISPGFQYLEVRIMLAFILGYILSGYQVQTLRKHTNLSKLGLPGIILLLLLINLGIKSSEFRTALQLEQMKASVENSNFVKMEEYAIKAQQGIRKVAKDGYPLVGFEAEALLQQGKVEEASSQFTKALTLSPSNFKLHIQAGISYLASKNNAAAIAVLQQAQTIHSKSHEASLYLSKAYLADNQVDISYNSFSAIPDNYQHPQLISIRNSILQVRIQHFLPSIQEQELIDVVKRILQDSNWLQLSWEHSRADNRHFDYQVILEGIYSLEMIDKSMDSITAERLRQHYQYLNSPGKAKS